MGSTAVEAYLKAVCSALREKLQQELAALWLGGSMVLADFKAEGSDIDLLCICRRPLRRTEMQWLSRALAHEALPCPALGLDLTVLLQDSVESPVFPLPYELGLASGRAWEPETSLGGQEAELLIDLEFCRRHGRCLLGKPPGQMIGPIPEAWIADALNIVVEWHSQHIHHPFHDPLGHNAVLNACRAMRWASDKEFVSKTQAGQWALQRDPSCSVIQKALQIRNANRNKPLKKSQVLTFLRSFLSP